MRRAVAAWAALALWACGAPAPAHTTPSAVPTPAASAAPRPSAALPSPTPSATAAPTTAPKVKKAPGTIACGGSTCTVGKEACCEQEGTAPTCRPIPPDNKYACSNDATIYYCDETADCGSGQRCCRTWGCTGGCPTMYACESGACDWGMNEICGSGATCSEGFVCNDEAPASCKLDPLPTPKCGKATCAAGQSCCWNEKTKKGACRESCPESDEVFAFACTSPKQCGGHPCGSWRLFGDPTPGVRFWCTAEAQLTGNHGRVICETIADCPKIMGMDPTGCKGPAAMPGLRECFYAP